MVVAKLTSPVGFPDKADLTLRLSLPRAVCERLMVRANRETYPSLAALVQAVLEREGKRRRWVGSFSSMCGGANSQQLHRVGDGATMEVAY